MINVDSSVELEGIVKSPQGSVEDSIFAGGPGSAINSAKPNPYSYSNQDHREVPVTLKMNKKGRDPLRLSRRTSGRKRSSNSRTKHRPKGSLHTKLPFLMQSVDVNSAELRDE